MRIKKILNKIKNTLYRRDYQKRLENINEKELEFTITMDRSLSRRSGKEITGDKYKSKILIDGYFYAEKSSYIKTSHADYQVSLYTYSGKIDKKLIYTYTYALNSDYILYSFIQKYKKDRIQIVPQNCYLRLVVSRYDNKILTKNEIDNLHNIVKFYGEFNSDTSDGIKSYFKKEISNTVETIYENTQSKSMVLGLLTDSHVSIGGTWEETAKNIKAVHERVQFDGIAHLGDVTDGRTIGKVTRELTDKCLTDLHDLNVPLLLALGNHDTNYQHSSGRFTDEEIYSYFFRRNEKDVIREGNKLYYYKDWDNFKIRSIILNSYSNSYGIDTGQVEWFKKILEETPEDYHVLVLTHVPPIKETGKEITNGRRVIELLDQYNHLDGKAVIGYFHGHLHIDQVYRGYSFPIINIGCAKTEAYKNLGKLPKGATQVYRELGTMTQDLWDTVIITRSKRRLVLVRFGAGEDRIINY